MSVIKELQGGSYLIKKGDSGKSMFLMISGRLVAIVPDNYGKPMVVGDIGRGECVGEMALINDGATRSADILAIRDTVVAEISKIEFDKLIHKYPSFLLRISKPVSYTHLTLPTIYSV